MLNFSTPPILHFWNTKKTHKKQIKIWKTYHPKYLIITYDRSKLLMILLKYRKCFSLSDYYNLSKKWRRLYIQYLLLFVKGGILIDPWIIPRKSFNSLLDNKIKLIKLWVSSNHTHIFISPPQHELWFFMIQKIEKDGRAPDLQETGFESYLYYPNTELNSDEYVKWNLPKKLPQKKWWFWLIISLSILLIIYIIIHTVVWVYMKKNIKKYMEKSIKKNNETIH